MPKKVEVKVEVKEIVSKIQDLSWDNLEVAEEQPQEPVCFEGLGEEAAEVHQWIRNEMEYRGVPHCESESEYLEIKPGQTPTRAPEPIPELTIDWQEDMMRFYREQLCQAFGLTPEELDSSNSIDAERLLKIAQDAEIANAEIANATLDTKRLATECMEAYIAGLNQNTTLNDFRGLRAAIRDLVDSMMASFDTFFKACSLLFDIRVLCVWDEFIWKMKYRIRDLKRKIKREDGMEAWEIHLTDHLLRNDQHPGMVGGVDWARTDISRIEYRRMTEGAFEDLRARGQAAMIQNHPHPEFDQFPSGALDLGTLTETELSRFRAQWAMHYGPISALAFCTPSRFGLTGRQ